MIKNTETAVDAPERRARADHEAGACAQSEWSCSYCEELAFANHPRCGCDPQRGLMHGIAALAVAVVLCVLGMSAPASAHVAHPRLYRVTPATSGVSTITHPELQRWHWRAHAWKDVAQVSCSSAPVQAKRRLQYRVASIPTALIGIETSAVQVRTNVGAMWGRWRTVVGSTGC